MDKRSELFRRFGPKLCEGLAILMMIEINELRTKLKLPLRTKEEIYNKIQNHIATASNYDWMTEEI